MKVSVLLWIDDMRNPHDPIWDKWIRERVMSEGFIAVHWVKKYDEFVSWIERNGLPHVICFDHDLSDIHIKKSTYKEKTGFDCAKWLTEYCMDKNLKLPIHLLQTSNPVGKKNIDDLLISFKKWQEEEKTHK